MAKGFGRAKRRREKLEQAHNRLKVLDQMIPWKVFADCLEQLKNKERKSNAGRKPFEPLLMFKMLILQELYNLSDAQTEYQTYDRISFRRFIGLAPEDEVPDEKTLWLFRQQLMNRGLVDELFEQFSEFLDEAGYTAQGGQIIDATFIPVPIQRNTREENAQIKAGEEPPNGQETPHKQSQKDTDARWTKKNNKSYFGYKDHINIDAKYGFIRTHKVTNASVHDSKVFAQVIDGENEGDEIWADSAYYNVNLETTLTLLDYISQIHERGYRNHPLNDEQKASNREKSKTRAKVEHVFGGWVMTMGGKLVRCIGIERVRAYQGLKDLSYNLTRYVFWQKKESCV